MVYIKYLYIIILFISNLLSQAIPHLPPQNPIPSNIKFHEFPIINDSLKIDLTKHHNKNINSYCSQTGIKIISKNVSQITLQSINLNNNDLIFIRYIENKGEYLGPFLKKHFNSKGLLTISGIIPEKIVIEYCSMKYNPETKLLLINIEPITYPHAHLKSNLIKKNVYDREHNTVLVTGFWPPTNEMIRHFSQDSLLNPSGWQGENWEDSGYNIVSFFPEFENPNCTNCGIGYGNLEVDYQDTSEDFWLIVNQIQPIAIITFSRGYMDHSWEIEYNYYNRTNWIPDYLTPLLPTPNPPDNDAPIYFIRNSSLPMETIQNIISEEIPSLNSYIDWLGDPGHFVSEFMGYHGVWYRDINQFTDEPCIIAGHIHVGGQINWDTARHAAEVTIRTVLQYINQLNYISGDLNDDYLLNIQDILILVQIITGVLDPGITQNLASDLNQDNTINVLDLIILVNIILEV